jgi:hypothetical protein
LCIDKPTRGCVSQPAVESDLFGCQLQLSGLLSAVVLLLLLLLLLHLLLLQENEKTRGKDDGAESGGVTGTDATMTDAAQTPEPGTTPEPDDKGDALAALLAAGAL